MSLSGGWGELTALPPDTADGCQPVRAGVRRARPVPGEVLGVWWRELRLLMVDHSGLRSGKMTALTADPVDPSGDASWWTAKSWSPATSCGWRPPKDRRRRTTMYSARTPTGMAAGPHARAPAGRSWPRRSVVPLTSGTRSALQVPAQRLRAPPPSPGIAPDPGGALGMGVDPLPYGPPRGPVHVIGQRLLRAVLPGEGVGAMHLVQRPLASSRSASGGFFHPPFNGR
jgi:hypothetical protein